MATKLGFIAVYYPEEGYKEFADRRNSGFGRIVTVTQMVKFARKCMSITLTPMQIRSTIHASGKQFGLVQIGSAFFKRVNSEWVVLA